MEGGEGVEPDLEAGVDNEAPIEEVGSDGESNSGASDLLEDLSPPSRPCS